MTVTKLHLHLGMEAQWSRRILEFLTQGKAFASTSNPSGVLFGPRQLLTKSDSGRITCAGLGTPNTSGAVGSLRPVQFTPKWLFFEVMCSDLSESCSANFKGLREGDMLVFYAF